MEGNIEFLNNYNITFTQTIDKLIFIFGDDKVSYPYIDLIKQMNLQNKIIPSTFNFDYINNVYRFFVKQNINGFFVCDLILNKYVFITINEIKLKIQKNCEEKKQKQLEEKIKKSVELAKEAYENFILAFKNCRDKFFVNVYKKKHNIKINDYSLSQQFSFDELEFDEKWVYDPKKCIFNKDELTEEEIEEYKISTHKYWGLQY